MNKIQGRGIIMHKDFQDNFIRIHMLYHANEQSISTNQMKQELEKHGYQVSENEIQQQLQHLASEQFLTSSQESTYSITSNGKQELKDVQNKLKILDEEVLH